MTARGRGLWMTLGCAALGAYFLLFSAGMLLSSRPYREQLQGLRQSLREERRRSPYFTRVAAGRVEI